MRSVAVLLLLVAASAAGCLSGRPDYDAIHDEATQRALLALEAAAEGLPTPDTFNLEFVGYHNGFDDSGNVSSIPAGGRYTELAVTPDRVYLARSGPAALGGQDAYGGFSIIDTRDPTDPRTVGTWNGLAGSDIEVDASEETVFFGTQRNTIEEITSGLATYQDPTAIAPRGISVVDVSDKRAPVLSSFFPLPYNGVHTIQYAEHPQNGREYIIACTYDLYGSAVPSTTGGAANAALPPSHNPFTQRVLVLEVMGEAGSKSLQPVSTYQVPRMPPGDRFYIPHDTFVQEHPVTGQVLLYVAYWDLGVRILDFTNPENLVELDAHEEFAPSRFGNIHHAQPLGMMYDDIHATVAEPEIPGGDNTGIITILDTTDPTDIKKLGWWQQPHPDLVVNGFDKSPHNFDELDGLIALGHQQLGLWIIDVSDEENMRDPKTVGYHFSGLGGPEQSHGYWGAFWIERDGDKYVLVSDTPTGLHVFKYTGPRA